MTEPIYLFNKTHQQRLEEFKDVLCSREPPVLASQLADEWSYSLQNFIEPGGWQALWKISRQICEELNLLFPKFVFVKVLNVDFKELTALVEVERVQDDISIPAKQEVPLTQLYPTKNQENSALSLDYTANFIDQLRFFYNHLWFPWDAEDSDGEDWPSRFLEPRLQLFYEMNNGVIPSKLGDKIHRIREQARNLYEQKRELEDLLSTDILEEPNVEDISSPTSRNCTYELMKIHLQLSPLLAELQLLENTSMRKLVILRFLEEEEYKKKNSNAIVVWQNGSIEEFISYLNLCKEVLNPKTCVVSASSFESAVQSAASGSSVFLPAGLHYISQNIESDVSIIGVGGNVPEVARKESHSYLWILRNATVKLQNIKLNADNVGNALQVYKNTKVLLMNCEITSGGSLDGRGIVVNSGGSVIIERCKFSGLRVAVCCYAGSQVSIQNSEILNCTIGIEAHANSTVNIKGGSIEKSKRAAIFISQLNGVNSTGNLELLRKFQDISVSQLQLVGNKDDVELMTELNPRVI